uniref:Uncharacterized protein n=1 Tax=Oncorhynchus tshawytscha TaxID=74940 RepID=A0A8C8F4X4_ONCTS
SEDLSPRTIYCSQCCQHCHFLGGGTPPESPPARYNIIMVLISSFENVLVYYALLSGGSGFVGPTLPGRLRISRRWCCSSRSLTACIFLVWLRIGNLQQFIYLTIVLFYCFSIYYY